MNPKELIHDSFQGIAMGMMDGLITLLGTLMGVGVATGNPQIVVISGLVAGVANSFGTSVGFYTSENAERGQQLLFYEKKCRGKVAARDKYIHTKTEIYMETLFSFLAGAAALVVPIIPFLLNLPVLTSMAGSLIISLAMLYILGIYIGKLNKESMFWSGVKYAAIGIVSAGVSLIIGEILKHILLENTIGIF